MDVPLINYDYWFPKEREIKVSPAKDSAIAVLESVSFTFTLEDDGLYLSYFPDLVAKEFELEIEVIELKPPNKKYKPVSIIISPIEGLKFADVAQLTIRKLGILSTVRKSETDKIHVVTEAKIKLTVKRNTQCEYTELVTPTIRITFNSEKPADSFEVFVQGIITSKVRLDLLEKANYIKLVEGKETKYTSNMKDNFFLIMQLFTYKEPSVAMMYHLFQHIEKHGGDKTPLIGIFLSFCEETCARNLLWLHLLGNRVVELEQVEESPCRKMLSKITKECSSVIQQEFLAHKLITNVNNFYLETVKSVYPFKLNQSENAEKVESARRRNTQSNTARRRTNAPICKNYHYETKLSQECFVNVKNTKTTAFVGGIQFDIQLKDTGLYIKYRPGEVVKELKYQIDVKHMSDNFEYDPMYLTVKRFEGLEWYDQDPRDIWEEHHLLETVSTKDIKQVDECHSNSIRIKITSLDEDWNPMKVKTVSKKGKRMIFKYQSNETTYQTSVHCKLIDFNKLEVINENTQNSPFQIDADDKSLVIYRKGPKELRTLLQYLTYERINDNGMKLAFESCGNHKDETQQQVVRDMIESKEGAKMMLYWQDHGLCEDARKMIYIYRIKSRKKSMKFQMDYMRYWQIGSPNNRTHLKNLFDKVAEYMASGLGKSVYAYELATLPRRTITNGPWKGTEARNDAVEQNEEADQRRNSGFLQYMLNLVERYKSYIPPLNILSRCRRED